MNNGLAFVSFRAGGKRQKRKEGNLITAVNFILLHKTGNIFGRSCSWALLGAVGDLFEIFFVLL